MTVIFCTFVADLSVASYFCWGKISLPTTVRLSLNYMRFNPFPYLLNDTALLRVVHDVLW
jgi:hypothetical protein